MLQKVKALRKRVDALTKMANRVSSALHEPKPDDLYRQVSSEVRLIHDFYEWIQWHIF